MHAAPNADGERDPSGFGENDEKIAMSIATRTTNPRPRTLSHPGRPAPVRIHAMSTSSARHFRLALKPGLSLFEALLAPLQTLGVRSASTTILAGVFESLQYCVATPDPERRSVVAYSAPREAGRCVLVFGNATTGLGIDGRPVVHCHAVISAEDGSVIGGHVLPESAIIGPDPIAVLAVAFTGFELRQHLDAETNMPLLRPAQESDHD